MLKVAHLIAVVPVTDLGRTWSELVLVLAIFRYIYIAWNCLELLCCFKM